MEVWKQIVGYEGYYEISSYGRVRSVDREIHYKNGRIDHRKSQIKSTRPRKDGYLHFNVSKNSVKSVLLVHQEVCAAFHGSRPDGLDVAHNNGVRSDNRETNLRYDTRKGNLADMVLHGTLLVGEKHHQTKVPDSVILEIRLLGDAARDKAETYGLHRNSVSRILRGERRNDLPALAA